MSPFRPANLNKRAYPGNASVIGPTRTATLGITTTTCCSSTNTCGACSEQNILGCRCTFCACPCCNVCCSCPCTVCDRTVPSGRWKASEQYEAKTRDAWGDDTCSAGNCTCLCCTNVGLACTGASVNDCKGFFICCGPSTAKWFIAPSCTETCRGWYGRPAALTLTETCMGCCGWFISNCDVSSNPGFSCRSYWDSYQTAASYWTATASSSFGPIFGICMTNGSFDCISRYGGDCRWIRHLRCLP